MLYVAIRDKRGQVTNLARNVGYLMLFIILEVKKKKSLIDKVLIIERFSKYFVETNDLLCLQVRVIMIIFTSLLACYRNMSLDGNAFRDIISF